MKLWVERYGFGHDSTLGKLYDMTEGRPEFVCYTLEDERRKVKVKHETAIPVGIYRIDYHKSSRFKERYAKRYEWHRDGWMLQLQDVPGFEGILIHPGNTDDDTSGCLLPGTKPVFVSGEFEVSGSVKAYKKLYLRVANALDRGEEVFITISERDK